MIEYSANTGNGRFRPFSHFFRVFRTRRPVWIGVLAFFLLLSVHAAGRAQDVPVPEPAAVDPPLLLDELIREAVENNPGLGAARELEEAREARIGQVSTLPDPTVSYALRNVGTEEITVGDEMMAGRILGFSQAVPFPGKLGALGDQASWDARAASYRTIERTLGVVAAVKAAFYDLSYIHRATDIINEKKTILRLFLETAEARYAAGRGAQADVLKAQVELSRLEERLVLLEEQEQVTEDMLNRLVGRDPGTPLGRPAGVQISTVERSDAELERAALENSPILLRQNAVTAREEKGLVFAKKQYFPDLHLGGSWMERGELADVWEARVGLEIPLYFWARQKNEVEEAAARYNMARYDEADMRLEVLERISSLSTEIESSARLYGLYTDTIVPQARLTLESSRIGYEAGEVDFLTLFDNLMVLLDYELEAEARLVRHENRLARLQAIIGEGLPE